MSASINLTDISWKTPSGLELFEHLNLHFGTGRTGLIGRNGVGKSTLLKIITGDIAPYAGSVVVEGRLAVLHQLTYIDPNIIIADVFGITEQLALMRSIEIGQETSYQSVDLDWSIPSRFFSSLARVGLTDLLPDQPLLHLSGGERTRIALAAMIFNEPDMLILDEPTNNLDWDGRQTVTRLLETWPRGALIVSHDRDLLEHMDTLVELTPLGAQVYGGNWSFYEQQKALEIATLERHLETAERKMASVERNIQVDRERKAKKDAAGKRSHIKGGAPKIALDARQNKAEKTTGTQARLAQTMREAARAKADEIKDLIDKRKDMSVSLASTGLSFSKTLVEVKNLTAGYNSAHPLFQNLSFSVIGARHVAIHGANGSGKSMLFKVLTGKLAPLSGSVQIKGSYAVLDQTMELLDPELTVRENYLRLNPGSSENSCRAALARFLFRADAALQTVKTLSGGQVLRAGLACVLGSSKPPELLLLDEPTNHLDIDSIQALEAGLTAYDGALLVISHDQSFLNALNITDKIVLTQRETDTQRS